MLVIYDAKLGVDCNLEGNLYEVGRKRNYNEITSIRGRIFTESSRPVKDLEIEVMYMSEDEYNKLMDMFLYSNDTLLISNTDDGKIYSNYFIKGDSFSLERKLNDKLKEYYYKGNITVWKR